MIKVFPKIEYNFTCPKCSAKLINQEFLVTGLRCLSRSNCSDCQSNYYCDLPTGQAMFTPLIIDIKTKNVYGREKPDWFTYPLINSLDFVNSRVVKIEKIVRKKTSSVTLVNCIDYLYGHSLLKLLNVQALIAKGVNCWIIIPKQLAHLVPDGVALIWVVDLPFKKANKWHEDLRIQINDEMARKKSVYLAQLVPHPNYTSFDINKFAKVPRRIAKLSKPVITFSYRENRCWGGNIIFQWFKLVSTYLKLRLVFPKSSFIVIGFGKLLPLPPGIVDLRTNRFNQHIEKKWLKVLVQTDVAFGIHGSNMLLPSALARYSIEYLPPSRLNNILQDYIPPTNKADTIESLFRFRILYGNESLSDISPGLVVKIITHLLTWQDKFYYQMYPGFKS